MQSEITVALITLIGSILGSVCSVAYGIKFLGYRMEQLEKKVDSHNKIVEQIFVLEEKIKTANHRIRDLEKGS
ncbi:hypothetical protein OL233_08260 [Vagococcus sp. PNs007]|uniref:Uncharacterized protein n=1 Tax=Vagococcus proximus TaxID=2991417 RepID=A0ABT5X2P2_9ENTE|nr:hypothetical protein [Vagococcus proximus]MDF0480275.1 hypothetical protein [Vagococcus proximus]